MNTRTPEVLASSEFVGALPPALAHLAFAPPSLVALPREAAVLVVPPDEQLRLVRLDAKSAGNLKGLRQMVAAWEAVSEKCDLAFEEMARLAVFRLEVERDLGIELAQTVSPGRPRKRSPEETFSGSRALPDGITKQQAARYRALATVPEPSFRAYVELSRDQRKIPSASGARRYAAPEQPARRRASRPPAALTPFALPASVIEAVGRVFTPEVCVGDAATAAKRRVAACAKNVFDALTGDVLVTDCPEPRLWLRTLRQLRKTAQIRDVIVMLPAAAWESWFRELHTDEWTLCFVECVPEEASIGVLVAHAGTRQRAFRLVFTPLGAVVPT